MATVFDKLMLQKTDFSNYRDISKAIDKNRFDPFIFEAQRGPMTKLIGRALYSAMQADYTPNIPTDEGTFIEQRFTDLWFGKTYISNVDNSFSVKFNGLKPAVIYWTYRRILHNQDINVTRYGVRKLADTDFSVDTTSYKYEVDAGGEALQYQSETLDFLEQFVSDYPEYFSNRNRERVGFKFMKI